MSASRPYSSENARARERLESVVADLGDEDMGRHLPNGWTAAQTLVHLAFWDLRQHALLKRWLRTGIGPSPVDVEAINEAILGIALAVPLREAGRLAIAAAAAVDGEVDRVPEDLRAGILASGHERALKRALHRDEHLDQIEKALG